MIRDTEFLKFKVRTNRTKKLGKSRKTKIKNNTLHTFFHAMKRRQSLGETMLLESMLQSGKTLPSELLPIPEKFPAFASFSLIVVGILTSAYGILFLFSPQTLFESYGADEALGDWRVTDIGSVLLSICRYFGSCQLLIGGTLIYCASKER